MRENVNASFTEYEWKPIKKRMDELGLNRYDFLRMCVFKECGIEIDRESETRQRGKIKKEPIRAVDGSELELKLES